MMGQQLSAHACWQYLELWRQAGPARALMVVSGPNGWTARPIDGGAAVVDPQQPFLNRHAALWAAVQALQEAYPRWFVAEQVGA